MCRQDIFLNRSQYQKRKIDKEKVKKNVAGNRASSLNGTAALSNILSQG